MEQGINVIYKLAESPDSICGDLIKKLTQESCQLEKPAETEEKQKEGEDEQMEEGGESQGKLRHSGQYCSYRIWPNYRTYPISTQSSRSVIFRLQLVYFLSTSL